ncbi:MAG: hypothetical protein LN364_03510 [Candidatus Thermoplasmatota archaeon]|nr:hypothetical protein [Candidatus Thermoplasmatota archaeon]
MDQRSVSPVDCDECKKGFHPSCVFKTKNGKNICIWCIREKINKLKGKNYGPILEDLLTEEEYNRFIITYGELGDKKLFV